MSTDSTNNAIPEKPSIDQLEEKFIKRWDASKIYTFDMQAALDAQADHLDERNTSVYSIDTPPPTASGSLHVGHMFSYAQTDVLARYFRMQGRNVFYPMGWDDNGLPTERRVQNYYGVKCDPHQPYDPHFVPPQEAPKNERDYIAISRLNFIQLCEQLSEEDEKVFEALFKNLGLSVDWNLTYRTIDAHSRKISQQAFLDNYMQGAAYMSDAPTLWDVTFQTAVAQAEIEDRDRPGAYHRVGFNRVDASGQDTKVFIETTRPELIPAAVALVAHPDDQRYTDLIGSKVTSPLFNVELPVLSHELAKPDKGSGLVMVSTFGDMTDVIWWRELNLPTRTILNKYGRIVNQAEWITDSKGQENFQKLSGKTVFTAQKDIIEMLRAAELLEGNPKPITHPVNFYEKGDKPLEIVSSRQWYIKNGGRNETLKATYLEQGDKISWHPPFMKNRYDTWVSGLTGDWLVSRQRFFGVPVPVWYQLDSEGEALYDNPILPTSDQLPVDPANEIPPGFTADQRGQAGGFVADPDVLDTWATSSLTPEIVGQWNINSKLFNSIFPFDLRPQAHEIIRTWLFSTLVRGDQLEGKIPWTNTAISGWVLDPDRKKMSKSQGNVIVPTDTLEEFGADAVRYWATSAKLGADTAFEVSQIKIGRRLAIKILNASKLILGHLGADASMVVTTAEEFKSSIINTYDQSLLAHLATLINDTTRAFDAYEYSRALSSTEKFFWEFTDDYLELVKDRGYGNRGDQEKLSALATLATTLDVLLRLFAPFLPFATDEVWSWWNKGSVHQRVDENNNPLWPKTPQWIDVISPETKTLMNAMSSAIFSLRKIKSEARVKQNTPLLSATLTADKQTAQILEKSLDDLKAASKAQELFVDANGDEQTIIVKESTLG